MKFEWDPIKDKKNQQKHKVPFAIACQVFADKYQLTIFDDEHSFDEDRWITMGLVPFSGVIFVVHTFRETKNCEAIRIISARRATRNEIKQYYIRRKDT